MNFLALATDYDGTLAHEGRVRAETIEALRALRDSGRKLLLVTGRVLPELIEVFPELELFDWVVAENGGLLYCPRTRETKLAAQGVPEELPAALRDRGVDRLVVGQSIVATWQPHECTVLECLRDLGLDRQIIFNKDAVMVLPTGVNKASGLMAVLREMRLSRHNVVSVGDAENDLPMLAACECGAAVANALDSVKERADVVLPGARGQGVEALIAGLMKDDLAELLAGGRRKSLFLGRAREDVDHTVWIASLGQSVMVAGPSRSGKSTAITGFLERMAEAAYQFCIFDPEGDYESFEPAITLGNPHYVPTSDEVVGLLERMHNAAVNLLGVPLEARPQAASEYLRKCQDLRGAKGRPHWFIVDEAHHIFPADLPDGSTGLFAPPPTSLMITVHPDKVHRQALEQVDVLLAVGKAPEETVRSFCGVLGVQAPVMEPVTLERGEVLAWFRRGNEPPLVVATEPGKTEHKRHIRKYAEGDLGPGSFTFTGPDGRLKLQAQNLTTFVRMVEGVDDATWQHHLQAGHVTEWFRWIIKNAELADAASEVQAAGESPETSRRRIIEAVRSRYTLPA